MRVRDWIVVGMVEIGLPMAMFLHWVFDLLIGGAIGLAFDAVLFIWLFAK